MISFSRFPVWLRPWLQLTKAGLCLPVAGTAGFGYILCRPVCDLPLLLSTLGVFALACGTVAGNNLQEVETERLYARTRMRRLMTGRLDREEAWGVSGCLVALGIVLLGLSNDRFIPALLGLAALIIYNWIYTPLKPVSALALIPGGIAGALPPVIGWTAAGGVVTSRPSLLLFALFFLWQLPHYFHIFFRPHNDSGQSGLAGILRQVRTDAGTRRLFVIWLSALIAVVLAFPLLLPQLQLVSRVFWVLLAVVLLLAGTLFVRGMGENNRQTAVLLFHRSLSLALALVATVQLLMAAD